jgi:beta-mannosidase
MGSNWVPVDSYHSRDKARIPQIMELLDDIGCNALRCWGGNIYEDPLFYRYCDEMGIMVWQDFAMACGVYPTDNDFKEVIYREAVQVIRLLRQHPSIILWAGDNECDQFVAGDGYGRDPNLNRLTREVYPDAVYNEDPTRPFLPSSPYIDEDAAKLPQEYLSENHLWGPRDYYKSEFYKGSLAHFASEMGYHGSVSVKSMKRFISPGKLWPWQDNDEWLVHAASPETGKDGSYVYRIELMAKQIKELFGVIPDNLEDFVLASQISQGEAKKFFVELFRIQSHRSGIIWWNLIDGWPQFSDAVVDYNFYKKLAYYYLRQSQRPLILTFTEPKNWWLTLCASNLCGTGPLEFSYRVRDFASGDTVLSGQGVCNDQETFELAALPYSQGEKKIYLIDWESGAYSGRNHYLAGNPPFDLAFYRDFLKKTYGDWYKEIFE